MTIHRSVVLVLTVALALSTSQAARADSYFTKSREFYKWINGKGESLTEEEMQDAVRAKGTYEHRKEVTAWGQNSVGGAGLALFFGGVTGLTAALGVPPAGLLLTGVPAAGAIALMLHDRKNEKLAAQRATVIWAIQNKIHIPPKVLNAYAEVWANDPSVVPVKAASKTAAAKQTRPSTRTATVAQRSGNQPRPTGAFQNIRNAVIGKLGRR